MANQSFMQIPTGDIDPDVRRVLIRIIERIDCILGNKKGCNSTIEAIAALEKRVAALEQEK